MRNREIFVIGYLLSSLEVFFLTERKEEASLLDHAIEALGWFFKTIEVGYDYYTGEAPQENPLYSAILPLFIFLSILTLGIIYSLDKRPSVTPVERLLQRNSHQTVENHYTEVWDEKPSKMDLTTTPREFLSPPRLHFRVRRNKYERFCTICRAPVVDNGDRVDCPACDSPFHYSHFAEWIKLKGTCPVCRAEIMPVWEDD